MEIQSTCLLTVFTPAYNRAHTIGRTYESLLRQSSKNFCWLVVDDGSSDNTRELVEGWVAEKNIDIRYIYQENQGMHGAHNTAYRNITTELNVCIDSDDYMPDDAVEIIEKFWTANGSDKYAGVIGLDYTIEGKLIGSDFDEGMTHTTLMGYYQNGGRGDKKCVYRTDLMQQTKEYPIFEGEKYVGLGCRCFEIDQKYTLLTINKPLVIVDYQVDGSSMSMYRQYWNNPRGFAYMRKQDMVYYKSLKQKLRACVHYVSSSIISGNKRFINESPMPFLTILSVVPGWFLYLHIRSKVRKQASFKIGK
ncbi:MAG: glycosyltransferase family 2 protein [Rikenellaceae bacterium]